MTPATRRRATAALAALLLIVLAGWWWAAPLLAVRAMQQAAARGDAQAFSEHVDYPRLRESLKGELTRQMTSRIGGRNDIAGVALGAMLGLGVADRLVDALVQPEIVMRVMEEGRLLPPGGRDTAPGGQPPAGSGGGGPRLHWSQEHQGLDRYVAHAWQGDADRRVSLVLERSGFATWKLVEIRLPPP